jgi:uncharacterized membrane protein YhaH (DUF805 family)
MAFFRAIASAFRNYVNFHGRANRREFWFWLIFVLLIWLLLMIVDLFYVAPMRGFAPFEQGAGLPVSNLWLLICTIPTLSLIARRVHDHGKSAWWALTILPLIWWLFAKGSKKENRYG